MAVVHPVVTSDLLCFRTDDSVMEPSQSRMLRPVVTEVFYQGFTHSECIVTGIVHQGSPYRTS
jgi:hypothetical protein